MDCDAHLDGSIWVDKEAEMRLKKTISTMDDMLFRDCSYHSENPLLICQNIDARAAKEETEEWRDWTGFFAIRVLGTCAIDHSSSSSCHDTDDNVEEIFVVDESDDSCTLTLENIRLSLLDGLIKSMLSDFSDLNSSTPQQNFPVPETSSFGGDFLYHRHVYR